MRKILILGGNGFIGKNLCSYLVSCGVSVFSFDMNIPEEKEEGGSYLSGDFFDDSCLEKIVKGMDIVFHCVCTLNPSNSTEKYMQGYSKDFLQTAKLCELSKKMNFKIVFLSSGGTVYGEHKKQPIKENAFTRPINHYGNLKLCCENLIRAFNVQLGLKNIIARISNPYGPGQDFNKGVGFIDAAIKKTLKGENITIFGDGNTVRDYIYIKDVCKCLYFLAGYEGAEDTFNVSSGVGASQRKILSMLESMGEKPNVVYESARSIDLKCVVLDNSKIMSVCDFDFLPLETGIKKTLEFLKTGKE